MNCSTPVRNYKYIFANSLDERPPAVGLSRSANYTLALVQRAKRKIILLAIMESLNPQSPGLKFAPECFKRPLRDRKHCNTPEKKRARSHITLILIKHQKSSAQL